MQISQLCVIKAPSVVWPTRHLFLWRVVHIEIYNSDEGSSQLLLMNCWITAAGLDRYVLGYEMMKSLTLFLDAQVLLVANEAKLWGEGGHL